MNLEEYTVCGHKLSLLSNPDVWSPYSATEMMSFLIEEGYLNHLDNLRVLDLGSGSGIIGILCGYLGAKEVTLSDYSHSAVQQALKNAQLNSVKAKGVQSDRFARFDGEEYDLIISNPPVQPWLYTEVMREDQRVNAASWNEAGKDGRLVLDALIQESQQYLSNNGTLITSGSTRHGHKQTIRLLEKYWKDNWKLIYAAEHAINRNYHQPYMPSWQQM
jgi:methylase of polypeptide subunit release factors